MPEVEVGFEVKIRGKARIELSNCRDWTDQLRAQIIRSLTVRRGNVRVQFYADELEVTEDRIVSTKLVRD